MLLKCYLICLSLLLQPYFLFERLWAAPAERERAIERVLECGNGSSLRLLALRQQNLHFWRSLHYWLLYEYITERYSIPVYLYEYVIINIWQLSLQNYSFFSHIIPGKHTTLRAQRGTTSRTTVHTSCLWPYNIRASKRLKQLLRC